MPIDKFYYFAVTGYNYLNTLKILKKKRSLVFSLKKILLNNEVNTTNLLYPHKQKNETIKMILKLKKTLFEQKELQKPAGCTCFTALQTCFFFLNVMFHFVSEFACLIIFILFLLYFAILVALNHVALPPLSLPFVCIWVLLIYGVM